MRAPTWLAHVTVLTVLNCSSSFAWAIRPAEVLVLYNAASTEGTQIANYYAQVHPGVQLLGLTGVSNSEYITADDYLGTLRPQVLSALTPTTNVIVTTKGLPLRINVTEPQPSGSYVDPYGTTRTILSWKPNSSLESELTAIDTISSWQMMGDQSYQLPAHFTSNPYYNSTASFSHATTGTRLAARLDGFTVSDVLASIDRAQQAFVGPNNSPAGPFHFLVDNDPTKNYAPPIANLVNSVLTPAGLPVTYDNTTAFVGTTTGPLLGYVSHGANQASTPPNYIATGLNLTLADGAVFSTWESFNARSFNLGGNYGNQGLVAEWLQKGGTAGVGNVAEPGASPSNVTNEDKLFQMLLSGKTFAEAAWSANRQLSYVNTVVGDPLMTWRTLTLGDANMDGLIDISDLAVMGAHWGNSLQPGGYGWSFGDFNSDGLIDISDLAIMGANWGQVSSWATGTANTAGATASQLSILLEPLIHTTPEPSSLALLALGAGSLWAVRRRKSRGYSVKTGRAG